MWTYGMSLEGMQMWLDVKDGRRRFSDLPPEIQEEFIKIEILNQIEDDLKLKRQGKAFGHQSPDSR